jgi:hypothetical protein
MSEPAKVPSYSARRARSRLGRKPQSCTRSDHHTPLPAPPLAAFLVMPTTS